MASLFESLPPEMVQKCVEFLPFDKLIERGAWAWSEGWENRAKARAFCAEIARVRGRLEERHAAELNGEYDSEVWDDGDDEDDDDD